MVRNFHMLPSLSDRGSIQKISKHLDDMNQMISNLIDMDTYRTLHGMTAEYTVVSDIHRTLQKLNKCWVIKHMCKVLKNLNNIEHSF